MRLLYVCSDFGVPPSGTKGASIHLRAITRALCDAGCEVELLSPLGGPDERHPVRRLLPPGCPTAEQSARALKDWLAGHAFPPDLARELRGLLYNACAVTPALEKLRGDPPDAIIERLSLLGYVGADLAQALGTPLILEVNALLTDEFRQFRGLQLGELATEIENRVLRQADAVLAVSAQLAERIAARGVDPARIHVVPNGADLDRFCGAPPRSECRRALDVGEAFVVGFVGSLKVWHGADVLLEAFAKLAAEHPVARLLVVGTGPQEAALKSLAGRLGLADAIFTGAVPHESVPRLIRAMDVAVAPYLPIDGFYFSPIKLFEYMAAGTCVVASRIGQITEVVEHERHGLLCEPGNVDDLCQAIMRLRDSAALREELAANASQLVQSRYTWSRAAQQILEVIDGRLRARTGHGPIPDDMAVAGGVRSSVCS